MTTRLIVFGLLGLVLGWVSVAPRQETEPLDLQLVALEDSGSYLVYRYAAILASGTNGAAAVSLDMVSPYGDPEDRLPATEPFRDLSALGGALSVEEPVEFGPISPSAWKSMFAGRTGRLTWLGAADAWVTVDSVAPGDTLSGFGLRSSFVPGVREVDTWPTNQSCCNEPWGNSTTNPDRAYYSPEEFATTSYTVGPKFRADEFDDADLANTMLDLCDLTDWVESSLCYELVDSTFAVNLRLQIDNYYGALLALTSMAEIVEEEKESMHVNAYYLMSTDFEQLYQNLLPDSEPRGEVELCAYGPSNATAYFSVTSTQPSLEVSSPHAVDTDSGCSTIWLVDRGVSELIDISVVLDSIDGTVLDSVNISGGWAEGDIAGDTAVAHHDGQLPGQVKYYFGGP